MNQETSRSRTYGSTHSTTRRTGTARGRAQSRAVRARRWWRSNRRKLRRDLRRTVQTVTPSGRFVLALTIVAIVLGVTLGWVEAWVVALVGAIMLLAALPFLLGNRSYQIRIVIDRMRVVAGGEVRLGIEVENTVARPSLPATAELPVGDALREIDIPFIGPHGSAVLPLEVPAPVRGVIEVGPVTLARRDPLGILRREVTWRDRRLVHVHPRTTFLPPGSAGLVRDLDGVASRRLTDSDLSFHAVRDYVHGDALRHVHWRSTAKTGMLMVRQYEETQTARAAILFDANRSEYASEEEFELGVSIAASLSLQAVREGRERFVASQWTPGRFRPAIDGLEELPSQTVTQVLDAWAELEVAEDAFPIETLARGLAESRRPLSVVFVVTGSVPDAGRMRRAAVSFPADVTVVAVRCELLADPSAKLLDVCKLLTVGELGDLPQLMLRGSGR